MYKTKFIGKIISVCFLVYKCALIAKCAINSLTLLCFENEGERFSYFWYMIIIVIWRKNLINMKFSVFGCLIIWTWYYLVTFLLLTLCIIWENTRVYLILQKTLFTEAQTFKSFSLHLFKWFSYKSPLCQHFSTQKKCCTAPKWEI